MTVSCLERSQIGGIGNRYRSRRNYRHNRYRKIPGNLASSTPAHIIHVLTHLIHLLYLSHLLPLSHLSAPPAGHTCHTHTSYKYTCLLGWSPVLCPGPSTHAQAHAIIFTWPRYFLTPDKFGSGHDRARLAHFNNSLEPHLSLTRYPFPPCCLHPYRVLVPRGPGQRFSPSTAPPVTPPPSRLLPRPCPTLMAPRWRRWQR